MHPYLIFSGERQNDRKLLMSCHVKCRIDGQLSWTMTFTDLIWTIRSKTGPCSVFIGGGRTENHSMNSLFQEKRFSFPVDILRSPGNGVDVKAKYRSKVGPCYTSFSDASFLSEMLQSPEVLRYYNNLKDSVAWVNIGSLWNAQSTWKVRSRRKPKPIMGRKSPRTK